MAFGKQGDGFGSNGGGSGAASDIIYKGSSPTTVTVGGEPAGTNIYGESVQQILQDILVPYIYPSFSSFLITSLSQIQEVGTTISGTNQFSWGFNQSTNVSANTMNIIDVTNSSTLASNISIISPYSVNIGTITNNSVVSHSWEGQATNTKSSQFTSSLFTINWYWRLWTGTSSSATLDAAGIQALSNSSLQSSFASTYNFAAGGYKYLVWDDSLGSPTAVTGFKDAATGLQLSMATVSDDAFYSNVQNGWYYGLVNVTQNGIASNKRVYRTANILGGSLTAIVS